MMPGAPLCYSYNQWYFQVSSHYGRRHAIWIEIVGINQIELKLRSQNLSNLTI